MGNKYGDQYGQRGIGIGGKTGGMGGKQMGGMSGMSSGMGGGSKHFQPSVINDDYILCQYCQRRYNDDAFAKHAPGCERRFKESQARNKIMQAPKKPLPKKK